MKQNFERVRVVICASDEALPPIQEAMTSLGIREALWCSDIDSMLKMLEEGLVDVLICDYSFLGGEFLVTAQKIRQKLLGRNPFLILIATADLPNKDMLRSLFDAGIDDLLRAPISPARMVAGINGFTRDRRSFVASYTYVGPTRRAADRDRSNPSSLITVPNTLQGKVVQNLGDAELQRKIDTAQVQLEDRQSDNRASQILHLGKAIGSTLRESKDQQRALILMDELIALTEQFITRGESLLPPQIINFLKLLTVLVKRMRREPGKNTESDLQLLENLTLAVKRALTVESDQVALMIDIIETISGHRPIH